jgi:hypothetical protein
MVLDPVTDKLLEIPSSQEKEFIYDKSQLWKD